MMGSVAIADHAWRHSGSTIRPVAWNLAQSRSTCLGRRAGVEYKADVTGWILDGSCPADCAISSAHSYFEAAPRQQTW